MRKSNYDKNPSIPVNGELWNGWNEILQQLMKSCCNTVEHRVIAIECYQGVHINELCSHLSQLCPKLLIDTQTLFKSASEIEAMTAPYMTNDRLFGYRTRLSYNDYLCHEKVSKCIEQIKQTTGIIFVIGHGAAQIISQPDILIYADMPRWEIQLRSRRKEIHGIGVLNYQDAPSIHYKRGYFIDWIVCDNLKKQLLTKVHFWLDTTHPEAPKMIDRETFLSGLEKAVHQPFRVVPFFDPAPWGGQWMKEICDLNRDNENYGWCFDCVPEENSLQFNINKEIFEMPANNLVFHKTQELLGAPVEARFGQDFPIRFDFLDTMGGGNLSLQVHPTTQYIHDTFGIFYTQDESYYLLDTGNDAHVYLGLKTGINSADMIRELNESQRNGSPFDVEKYVNKWPAHKHDHFLIPAGTVHCSGANAMVLEISTTPSLFTFKLYDWGRLGLDGIPRPINIVHGSHVIQWERQTEWVQKELFGHKDTIAKGDGWIEERTGLHENEFIETHRHWFSRSVLHNTGNSVNVLNLVEGDEAIVESPTEAFKPFVVHYAETFIIPAAIGNYSIRPYGLSIGKTCATIKACIRFKQ